MQNKDEMKKYMNGLLKYAQKGIPVFVDGEPARPEDWEKLFEVREDGRFYMGDYVQTDSGGLKEIRFDKVYLCSDGLAEGRRRRRR